MKKNSLIIGFILIALFSTNLFSQLNQQSIKLYPIETEIKNIYTRYDTIPAPEWEFIKYPTELMTSYYDYMPGGYNGYPLRLRTVDGNDIVLTFQASPVPTSNREIYMTYIYEDGTIEGPWSYAQDGHPGFPAIVIHSSSGNIIYAYHSIYGIVLYYEDFLPGFWPPALVVEGGYLCPNLYIGPSPIEDKVRVYLLSSSEDVRVMYIDIDEDENVNMDELLNINNWSEVFVFTDWSNYEIRPYPSFAVSWDEPGKVAFMGYAGFLADEITGLEPVDPGYYVWESYDYGETWDYANLHSYPNMENRDVLYQVENIPGFGPEGEPPFDHLDVWLGWPGNQHSCHRSALYDGEDNLHMPQLLWICYVDREAGSVAYWPYYLFQFQADIVYKADGTWEIRHVPLLPGTDPWTGYSVPWTWSETDTTVYPWLDMSTSDIELAFHENIQHQAVNKENNWMVQVWASGTKLLMAENQFPSGWYDPNYLGHPIIHISASKDNGEIWSDPIELSDIYSTQFPEFANQITVYPYVAPYIKDLGDGWGQVYMYYFDDNDYGSSLLCQGPNTGGQITYCSFKINFDDIVAVDEEQEVPSPKILLYNYPNPFHSSTTISFLATDLHGLSQIKIYNVKGQLVKELVPDLIGDRSKKLGVGEAIWNGKDENDRELPNGIYLYQLNFADQVITKKMILLR